jgi:BTB/POZ domain
LTNLSRNPHTVVAITVCSPDGGKETFEVYKDFICYYSPFFRAAFNGPFKEGQTQTMEFTDTHPVIFGLFVLWLYSQGLDGYHENPELAPNLVKLWILADTALIPQLQNDITRILCGYSPGWCPAPKTILTVYAKTGPDSAMRKLVIRSYAFHSPNSEFPATTVGLYEEIVFDIAVCLKNILHLCRTGRNSRIRPQDYYVSEK